MPDRRCGAEERARRERRLRACADHVRWEALRNTLGRSLVVTYKAVEEAFQGIPGVETAHFNATAGLDIYGDVSALIVIGRPLPPDTALAPPSAALFGHALEGGYGWATQGVRMRVMRHEDKLGEIIRAAICDDEVIQCIGRGPGLTGPSIIRWRSMSWLTWRCRSSATASSTGTTCEPTSSSGYS